MQMKKPKKRQFFIQIDRKICFKPLLKIKPYSLILNKLKISFKT